MMHRSQNIYPVFLHGANYIGDARVMAFLDTIARAEGTYNKGNNGYNVIFGGSLFTSYNDHPRKCIPFRSTCSTAAGRYQFLKGTWDGLRSTLGLNNFSPGNQDLAAIELLRTSGALNKILSNDITGAVTAARKIWASFPGAGYNQGERSMNEMISWYNSYLQQRSGSSSSSGNNQVVVPVRTGSGSISPEWETALWIAAGIGSVLLIYNSTR